MKTKSLNKLVIATRKSQLALWQSNFIKQQLLVHHPDCQIDFLPLVTEGDRKLDTALNKVGGKGLFVKALEDALLAHRADIAVHSVKDMPAYLPQGLALKVVGAREDPRDALVAQHDQSLDDLPPGAVVGTSSLRRICQLRALRADLEFKLLRGNVNTRVKKLDAGEYDAIILAAAGLRRLGLAERISAYLPVNQIIPAVGQGALGIEYRQTDEQVQDLITPLDHAITRQCVTAERAMNAVLNGGCQVPIAGHALIVNERLHLSGLVGNANSGEIISAQADGDPLKMAAIGKQVAEALLKKGARKLLDIM